MKVATMNENTTGVLRRCMDLRFGDIQRLAFMKATGLKYNEFYDLAYPGGAALPDPTGGFDLVLGHGVKVVGMAAHGEKCAGQPGISDDEIVNRLEKQIADFQRDYSGLTVFALFSTVNGGTKVWSV